MGCFVFRQLQILCAIDDGSLSRSNRMAVLSRWGFSSGRGGRHGPHAQCPIKDAQTGRLNNRPGIEQECSTLCRAWRDLMLETGVTLLDTAWSILMMAVLPNSVRCRSFGSRAALQDPEQH